MREAMGESGLAVGIGFNAEEKILNLVGSYIIWAKKFKDAGSA
jgi:hypothetical protein